jgi:hypothetical protein
MPVSTLVATNTAAKILLAALLPRAGDFASQLGLDIPQPVTESHVARFHADEQLLSGVFALTNGLIFHYAGGRIFQVNEANLNKIEQGEIVGGVVRISEAQALEKVRTCVRKFGKAELDAAVMLAPDVERPVKLRGGMSAFYTFRFYYPNDLDATKALEAVVNADCGRLEMFRVDFTLWPQLVPPELERLLDSPPAPTPEPIRLPELSSFLADIQLQLKLFSAGVGIELPQPLTTNSVATYAPMHTQRGPFVFLLLTNNIAYYSHKGMVASFALNDMFFSEAHVGIDRFVGRWRMTRHQATAVAKEAIRRLGNRRLIALSARRPELKEPRLIGRRDVPRLFIRWVDRDYEISAEVDAERGRLVRLDVLPPLLWK